MLQRQAGSYNQNDGLVSFLAQFSCRVLQTNRRLQNFGVFFSVSRMGGYAGTIDKENLE